MREFIIFISACSCLILPGKDLHVFSHSEYAWLQLPAPAPVAFPSLLRSLSELGVFPHQAAPCCEHIVFQVSPQLAKQVEVLNPSLQSVPFHPQIIFMALFCTGSLFIIPLMRVDGLSLSSPGAGVTSLPWASPLLEHLRAGLASLQLSHAELRRCSDP